MYMYVYIRRVVSIRREECQHKGTYIRIHMYTNYIYILVFIFLYIYTHVFIFLLYIYVCEYKKGHEHQARLAAIRCLFTTHVFIYMFTYVYICMYIYMYTFMFTYVYICIYTHMYTYMYVEKERAAQNKENEYEVRLASLSFQVIFRKKPVN